jgi:hypothetical protein
MKPRIRTKSGQNISSNKIISCKHEKKSYHNYGVKQCPKLMLKITLKKFISFIQY